MLQKGGDPAHRKYHKSEGIVCHVVGEMGRFVTEFTHNGNGTSGDKNGVDISFQSSSGTFLLQIKSSDFRAEEFYREQKKRKKLRTRRENGNGGNDDLPIHILVIKQETAVDDVSRDLSCLTGFKRKKKGGCQGCKEKCIVFRLPLYLMYLKREKRSSKKRITRTFLRYRRIGGLLH